MFVFGSGEVQRATKKNPWVVFRDYDATKKSSWDLFCLTMLVTLITRSYQLLPCMVEHQSNGFAHRFVEHTCMSSVMLWYIWKPLCVHGGLTSEGLWPFTPDKIRLVFTDWTSGFHRILAYAHLCMHLRTPLWHSKESRDFRGINSCRNFCY